MPMKQNSASMPQNLAFKTNKQNFGSHATKPKLGFHATKTNFHVTNKIWLLCHNQNSVFMPSEIRPVSHKKTKRFATKSGFHAQNKLLTKDFHKMTTFWSNFQTNHSHSIFAYVFIKSELSEIRGYKKKKVPKNVYTWRYQKKRRKSLLQIRRLVRHGLQPKA